MVPQTLPAILTVLFVALFLLALTGALICLAMIQPLVTLSAHP